MKELKRRSFFWVWIAFFVILIYDVDLIVNGTAFVILGVLFLLIKRQHNKVNKKASERKILRYNTRKEVIGGVAVTTAFLIFNMGEKYEYHGEYTDGVLIFTFIAFMASITIHMWYIKRVNAKILEQFIERSDYNNPDVGGGVTLKKSYEVLKENGKYDVALFDVKYRGGLKIPEDIVNEGVKIPKASMFVHQKEIVLNMANNVGTKFDVSIPHRIISAIHIGVEREYYVTRNKKREYVKDVMIYIDLLDGRRAEMVGIVLEVNMYNHVIGELKNKVHRGYDVNISSESIKHIPRKEVTSIFALNNNSLKTKDESGKGITDRENDKTLGEETEKQNQRMIDEEKAYAENVKSKSHMFTEKYKHPLERVRLKPLYTMNDDMKMMIFMWRVVSVMWIFTIGMEMSFRLDLGGVEVLLLILPPILLVYIMRKCSKFRKTKLLFNNVVDLYNNEEEFSAAFYKDSLKLKAEEVYELLPDEDRVVVMSAITNYLVKNYPLTLERLSKLYAKEGVDGRVRGNLYLTSIYVECLVRCGRLDEALEMLESLKHIEGLKVLSETLRAEALMNKGRAQEAIGIIDNMFDVYGRKGKQALMLKYVQGKSYYRIGRSDKALELFKDIYEEDDKFEDVSVLIENIESDLEGIKLLT